MRLWDTPVPISNTMVKTQTADGTLLETARESRWMPLLNGGVAQLGEHLPCKQGVKSSNLSISIRNKRKSDFSVFQKEMYLENYILKYKTSNQISKKQTQTIETLNDCDATQSEADRDCEGDKLECPAQSTKKGQAKKSAGWMPWH